MKWITISIPIKIASLPSLKLIELFSFHF